MYYLTKDEYLEHARKSGWTKKNHKYISRYKKNGKWFYVYKNGKKYNKLQDWLGVDEWDSYKYYTSLPYAVDTDNLSSKVDKAFERSYDRNLTAEERKKADSEFYLLSSILKKRLTNERDAVQAFYKTPMGKLATVSKKVHQFIDKFK